MSKWKVKYREQVKKIALGSLRKQKLLYKFLGNWWSGTSYQCFTIFTPFLPATVPQFRTARTSDMYAVPVLIRNCAPVSDCIYQFWSNILHFWQHNVNTIRYLSKTFCTFSQINQLLNWAQCWILHILHFFGGMAQTWHLHYSNWALWYEWNRRTTRLSCIETHPYFVLNHLVTI